MKLHSLSIIDSANRNSSIDVFRALAVISVVLFHFYNYLPYGFLGVDLFFVLSGFLVSGLLIKDFKSGKSINFFRFFLQRGLKILPSFYVFLVLGNIVAYLLYKKIAPEQYIPFWDLKRYVLFYRNYSGLPHHWTFDHIWSLCVEEHFYVGLPLLFIFLQLLRGKKNLLFATAILVILMGISFKILTLYFTNSKDTYAGTHNRIDALAWGVLLNLLITYYPRFFKKSRKSIAVFALGVITFLITLAIEINTKSVFFHKVLLHSIIPLSFFLMLAGSYRYNFSRLIPLRFVAYYSYNWYLWHPLFLSVIGYYIGMNIWGLALYSVLSFGVAMLATIIIEEPIVRRREQFIQLLFARKAVPQLLPKEPVIREKHEQPV